MPLRRKTSFASLALLLFTFPALEFASAQCAIEPIKPIPPLGCKDVTPQCVTISNGQSYWTWVCVPDSGGADANSGPARQAPAPERAIPRATDQSPVQTAPVNPVVVAPQTHVQISEDSKAAVERLRTIAQRIGECPKVLDFENQWGRKKDEIEQYYQGPPENIVWDVVAGDSVRAPYLGYVEFTINENQSVPDSAMQKFQQKFGQRGHTSLTFDAFFKILVTFPLHLRYEYDLGPSGLQLTRVLHRNKNTRDSWQDANIRSASSHCWDTAARNTQTTKGAPGDHAVSQDNAQAAIQRLASLGPEWQGSAEQGDPVAQYNLGASYELGSGLPQDLAKAAMWYRKAGEQGYAVAQYSLGTMYSQGRGVPQDYAQAAIWLRKAAEQGIARAQIELSALYAGGQGVPQDNIQAVFWLRKAAEQGNGFAEILLGFTYAVGKRVPQDYAQAAIWFRKAAEQGEAEAQEYLGILYANGHGVPQDYAEAYFWLYLAAAGKLDAESAEGTAKDRDEAASHLSPADQARVQERARKWFEDHPSKPQ